jgi:hypothetical protein
VPIVSKTELVNMRTAGRLQIGVILRADSICASEARGRWEILKARLGVLSRGASAPKSQYALPLLTSEFPLVALVVR